MSSFASGAILDIRRGPDNAAADDDYTFTIKQTPNHVFFDSDGKHGQKSGDRINIRQSFGPLALDGYVDIGDREIVINVTVAGVSIGTYKGSFQDGISFGLNLLVAKGHVRLYVKNSVLYLDYSIKITFDGEYKDTVRIIGWD